MQKKENKTFAESGKEANVCCEPIRSREIVFDA